MCTRSGDRLVRLAKSPERLSSELRSAMNTSEEDSGPQCPSQSPSQVLGQREAGYWHHQHPPFVSAGLNGCVVFGWLDSATFPISPARPRSAWEPAPDSHPLCIASPRRVHPPLLDGDGSNVRIWSHSQLLSSQPHIRPRLDACQ